MFFASLPAVSQIRIASLVDAQGKMDERKRVVWRRAESEDLDQKVRSDSQDSFQPLGELQASFLMGNWLAGASLGHSSWGFG